MRHAVAASLVSLAACAFEPSGPGDLGPGPDPDPPLADVDGGAVTPTPPAPVECRVEGPNLGVVGLTVEVPGGGTWRFESWQALPSGEPAGFTLSGPPNPSYEVRADRDRFWVTEMVFVVPRDKAISRVDFCAEPRGRGDD